MPAPDIKQLLEKGRSLVNSYAETLLAIYAEKGIEPFKKPLSVCVPVLLLLYLFGYRPLGDRIASAAYKLESDRAVAESAGEFSDTRDRMTQLMAKLPPLKEKDDWLNALLANTIKKYGISFDQLSPQTELTVGNFIVASRTVEFTSTYDVVGRWLADVEATPQFLRVVTFSISRDTNNPLQVKASVTVSTIFSKSSQLTQAGGAS